MADEEKKPLSLVPRSSFTNIMRISHTDEEFYLDFGEKIPGSEDAFHIVRLVTTPREMKRILRAIEENVAKYEERFGVIPDTFGAAKAGGETSH